MRRISTTNARRRRVTRNRADRRSDAALDALLGLGSDDDACGQCEGTGTIDGGLSGHGDDEECPVCDGSGILPDS
jgi:DnaJ-class molecular chaperone